MAKMDKERLIELVTAEVMRMLENGGEESEKVPECAPDAPRALLIGQREKLPVRVQTKYSLCDVELYKDHSVPVPVEKFEAVFITRLSLTEFSDIAAGRDAGRISKTVIDAIMNGKKIYLMETSFFWRKQKAVIAPGFYQLLEGHVRTLRNFGIEVMTDQTVTERHTGKPLKTEGLPEGLITEQRAFALVEKRAENKIRVRKGTVITPSARDVFLHAGKTIEIV